MAKMQKHCGARGWRPATGCVWTGAGRMMIVIRDGRCDGRTGVVLDKVVG